MGLEKGGGDQYAGGRPVKHGSKAGQYTAYIGPDPRQFGPSLHSSTPTINIG